MSKLTLKNIYKVYDGGVMAVSDFNLEINDKEFIVFVGPSGCGKSTTLRMIAGLEEITSGELYIDDTLMNDIEPKDRNIAMVFQNYALYPHMSVFQNMAFGLKLRKNASEDIEKRVKRAAEILGITDLLTRKPKALSGGQRQRVALGRAIVREPNVFLLDEPLSNLDAKLRLEMRSELKRLHLETGSTFVYVTHDQQEAMTLASKICLMNNGVIQQYEPPLSVYKKPVNLFVGDFIGSPSINFIEGLATQNNDKEIHFDILNGIKCTFNLETPLNLEAFVKERDERIKAEIAKKEAMQKEKGYIEKENADRAFNYHIATVHGTISAEEEHDIPSNMYILGVRPEFIKVANNKGIEAEIYSSLPTGSETTVKLKINDYIITSVLYGDVTYTIGDKINIEFAGAGLLLFDRVSGKMISRGSLKIN